MSRRLLALAVCWLLVNAASITHSAWSFAQLERAGWWWLVGVVAAVGTDAGMAALTWLAMERRREHRPLAWPVLGVLIAGAAVAYANVDHALGVVGAWGGLTWWVRSRVLVLSLILPLLTVLLSALVEHEHAEEAAPVVSAARARPPRRRPRMGERVESDGEPILWLPREHRPAPATLADGRLAAVRAHLAAHPDSSDVQINEATGVPRATVGRWRRRGLLAPEQPVEQPT